MRGRRKRLHIIVVDSLQACVATAFGRGETSLHEICDKISNTW